MLRVSPSDRYSDVPSTPWAFFPAVTSSSSALFSRATSAVMIFVQEASGSISSAFWAKRMRPLSPSISTAPFAATVSASEARAAESASSAAAAMARNLRLRIKKPPMQVSEDCMREK